MRQVRAELSQESGGQAALQALLLASGIAVDNVPNFSGSSIPTLQVGGVGQVSLRTQHPGSVGLDTNLVSAAEQV